MVPWTAINSHEELSMNNPIILIAECDETLRQNLKNGLPPHGFDLIEANGIKDILRSLQDRQPDLVRRSKKKGILRC